MPGELQPRPLAHFRLGPHLLSNGLYRITINLSAGQGHQLVGEPLANAVRDIMKEMAIPGSVRAFLGGVDTKVTFHFDPQALGGLAGRMLFADRLAAACAAFEQRPRALWLLPFEFAEGALLTFSPSPSRNLRALLERRRLPDWQARFTDLLDRDTAVGSVRHPELARALSAQMSLPAEVLVRRAITYTRSYGFRTELREWPEAEMTTAAHWLTTGGWLERLAPNTGVVRTAHSGHLSRALNAAGYVPVYAG